MLAVLVGSDSLVVKGKVLLIDAGNTRVKWRLIKTLGERQDGVAAWAESRGLSLPEARAVRWVAGERVRLRLQAMLSGRADCSELSLDAVRARVQPNYEHPRQMGADRLLALLAAGRLKELPCAVIDAGTAITVDLLDKSGRHAGGVILPGFGLMRRIMLEQLGLPAADEMPCMPPRDTASAVAAGMRFAGAGGIQEALRRLEEAAGVSCRKIVVTGGDAEQVMPHLGPGASLHPNLVLDGLELAWTC